MSTDTTTETFSSYLHRRRLELSIQRGLLLSQQEYLDYITKRLTSDIRLSLFTLRRLECGARIPTRATEKAIKEALDS